MTVNYQERRARLAAMLPAHEVDAMLVTSGVNVRYLTGLASSNAAVLVGADGSALLVTDNRYIDKTRGLRRRGRGGVRRGEPAGRARQSASRRRA